MSGDREEPKTERRRYLSRSQSAAALMVGAGVLIGISFWRSGEREVPPPAEPTARIPQPDFREVALPARIELQAPPPPAASAAPVFAPSTPAAAPRRMASYAVAAPPSTPAPAPAASSREGEEPAGTTVAFRGQAIAGGRAGAAIDTSLTLMPGIYGCILDTAVNSERPGPFQCHTSEPIRSPLGVPLMDAGTTIIGQYESDVRQGQARVPGLVVTAWTPQGVPVPLGAIVADELGRVGMPGRVNRHLAERFGGAFALLATQGAMDLARTALMQGNGNSTVNLNTGSVQGVAADALRSTIGIRNTVEKNQGEPIAFFIAAPVSFDDAYRLRLR